MIGERIGPVPIREYGHPPGIYETDLVTVPWFVVDRETFGSAVVDERLAKLGYRGGVSPGAFAAEWGLAFADHSVRSS